MAALMIGLGIGALLPISPAGAVPVVGTFTAFVTFVQGSPALEALLTQGPAAGLITYDTAAVGSTPAYVFPDGTARLSLTVGGVTLSNDTGVVIDVSAHPGFSRFTFSGRGDPLSQFPDLVPSLFQEDQERDLLGSTALPTDIGPLNFREQGSNTIRGPGILGGFIVQDLTFHSIPEPASLNVLLLGGSILVAIALKWRRRGAAAEI
jgi:hypothetical protein